MPKKALPVRKSPGKPAELFVDGLQPPAVADDVLGDGPLVTEDAAKVGGGVDAHDVLSSAATRA